MITLTRRYFVCLNGHEGEEVTSEDDQPDSPQWESNRTSGLVDNGTDSNGFACYRCKTCGEPMCEAGRH
ncbi:hypothetical protein [Paraburkholderia nodosa]|uniref:hypothetical protein n=1 Tax=Paraburkholderia nodosa TaxID=392320 RepID=UPI000484AD75|nr:hypothetical protein [Paraburkholderia nodosa]